MILSIIVPIYNDENFISICLESLLEQNLSLNTYEIIIINDGSTDNSKEVVEIYSRKYSNIILFNQKNSGNGAARNKGIEMAKGKYLYFIDSDDYIAINVLDKFLDILEENKLDILGFNSVNTNSSKLLKCSNFDSILNSNGLHIIDGIQFIGQYNYRAEVWWYIVNKDFFLKTKLSFYDRKFVQDAFITPTIFKDAKRVIFLPIVVHRYRINENSITNRKSPEHLKKHIYDLMFSIEKLTFLINSISNKKAVKRLKNRQQSYAFFLFIRFTKSDLNFKEFKNILKKLKSLNAYPFTEFLGADYSELKYNILARIFNNRFLLIPLLMTYKFCYNFFYKKLKLHKVRMKN